MLQWYLLKLLFLWTQHVETVVQLTHKNADGFKVHTAYITEVKRSLGLLMYDAPNAVKELKYPHQSAPAHKIEAIKDALKHFEVI